MTDIAQSVTQLSIPFERYQLKNGLQVILHEDHSLPVVSVNVWYHVGSKNEKPGRTGFAHLFEHMMFQGSQHRNEYYSFDSVGGSRNGSTNQDRTNYWENIPGNYLELALWMEADRMGFLIPALSQERLDNQRDVVKNERRQRYENQPYGRATETLLSMLFPTGHPYSWPTIGSMADLSAASRDDVIEFFKTYYAPNNASLCITGDFQPAQAKEWVEKYFGSIPAGPQISRMKSWTPQLEGVRLSVAEDNVELPRIYFAWHTPAIYQPGDAEFRLLANILASGKTSRLYRSLVYEKQIAQEVEALQWSRELGSNFVVSITAREGQSLEDLQRAADVEIEKLIKEGVTLAELEEAKNQIETEFLRNLESVGGFGGKADILNAYNTFLDDPGKLQWDLDRFSNATAASIKKYANDHLALHRRAILHVVPQGSLHHSADQVDRSKEPTAGAPALFRPPQIHESTLSNGIKLLLVEDRTLPLVHMNVIVKSGWSEDPAEKPGAASLTSELLDEGTTTRNALQIAAETKRLGAELRTAGDFDSSRISLNVAKKNFDPGLSLLADVVLHPTFPEAELERQRKIYLGRIQQESKEPSTVAMKVFMQQLYGTEHPYAQPHTGSGTESSINAIVRKDLLSTYQRNYSPNNTAIVIAGDITMEEAQRKIEKHFAGWKQQEVARRQIAPAKKVKGTRLVLVDKPGAAQSYIVMGNLGAARKDKDYYANQVLNSAFGGRGTSRIYMNLRQEKGYSYGVRSFFWTLQQPGPFYITAPVQTQSTKESIAELLKELRDIRESRPMTPEELMESKDYLTKRYPQLFEGRRGIAAQLSELVLYDLPRDEWPTYEERIREITAESTGASAKQYLDPANVLIVVVGDKAVIEPKIRELQLGEITYADAP